MTGLPDPRATAAEGPGPVEHLHVAPSGRPLPSEGRRALVATALGAGLGLLVALCSKRDPDPAD